MIDCQKFVFKYKDDYWEQLGNLQGNSLTVDSKGDLYVTSVEELVMKWENDDWVDLKLEGAQYVAAGAEVLAVAKPWYATE
jgi:hypothetical protein